MGGGSFLPPPVRRGRAGEGVCREGAWNFRTPTLTLPRSTGRGNQTPAADYLTYLCVARPQKLFELFSDRDCVLPTPLRIPCKWSCVRCRADEFLTAGKRERILPNQLGT